ncbi:MAG TPA: hypothetical protein VN181_01415 [Thermoanaerobaculia bacterium]|nr:hypothetical protein [Thermoanaerobaculia bacterium]
MRNRWIIFAGALVFAALVGALAWNAGVAHGIEHGGKVVAPNGPYPYYGYGWHPPLFFFGPFSVILFVFLFARALSWRRGWHRGCGSLEEWHRQAHEKMWNGEDDPRRG